MKTKTNGFDAVPVIRKIQRPSLLKNNLFFGTMIFSRTIFAAQLAGLPFLAFARCDVRNGQMLKSEG
jgi:hypothetical protein